MVERWMQGDHRRKTGQAQNHPSLPWCTSIWTPRYQLNKGSSGQILLVATADPGCSRVHQGMCSMSTKLSKYASSESPFESHYTNNRSTTIPDYIHGLYCETTRIGGIRFYIDYHGSWLHKNANHDTLQRNNNGWRSSQTIFMTDLPQIWITIQDHQW